MAVLVGGSYSLHSQIGNAALPCVITHVQAYPFVARKVLRDDGSGTAALLRDLVYDEQGKLRPGRLSALLQVRWGDEVA
jgi:hypothetical protein